MTGPRNPWTKMALLLEGPMNIKKRDFLLAGAAGLAVTAAAAQSRKPITVGSNADIGPHTQPSSVDLNYKPRRINKAIELWEDGQPIYYGHWGFGPGMDPYAHGVKWARTHLDAINV